METTAGSAIFIDTNIIIMLAMPIRPTMRERKRRLPLLQEAGYELWVSRPVLREFGVVVSRQILARNQYDADAWRDEIEKLEREYFFADEDADVTHHWKLLVHKHEVKGKTVHDANIVATMMSYGIHKLLTQNIGDFRRFEPQIEILLL